MATFSTNQVRQLYVANAYKASLTDTDAVGTIEAKSGSVDNIAFLKYVGVDTLMCSDTVKKDSITYAKVTAAADMDTRLSTYSITLDSNILTEAVGQEAIVRIVFRNFIGISEQDQIQKYGSTFIKSGMTASDFYKELAKSLAIGLKSPNNVLLDIYVSDGTDNTIVKYDTDLSKLTGTYTKIVIVEHPQDWILGVKPLVSLNFVPQVVSVEVNGMSEYWGTIVREEPVINKASSGIKMADLEYFCMGERGDIYRNVGFPKVIHTKYLVDPTKEYNIIDIAYSYKGEGVFTQKSNKVLSIAVPAVGETIGAKNALTNTIVGAINTAFGTTIEVLPTT